MRKLYLSALLFMAPISAHAQCSEPTRYSPAEAASSEFAGSMFANSRKTGQSNFADVTSNETMLIENGKCYQIEKTFRKREFFQGTVFINNFTESLDPKARKNHDMTFLQIRLSPKAESTGSFKVTVARSGPDRNCSWYRGAAAQDHFRPGEVVDTSVGSPRTWNDVHDIATSIAATDRVTQGQFHGSASPDGPSTFDRNNREKFRLAESLTDAFDVVVSIRLICFSGAHGERASMLPMDVTSGEAGVIVSYFSSSSSLAGSARFCAAPFCNKVNELKIGNPYAGLLAYLFSRRQ